MVIVSRIIKFTLNVQYDKHGVILFAMAYSQFYEVCNENVIAVYYVNNIVN